MSLALQNNGASSKKTPTGPCILIVEDEALVAADIELRLTRLGYRVAGPAQDSQEAISLASETPPDLVLMDINLGKGADGVATANAIRQHRDVPIIYLTANSDPATVERAAQSGPLSYLLKPFEDKELEIAIRVGLARAEMENRLRKSEQRFVATVSSLADGVIATNPEGRVTFLNRAAERLTGRRLVDAVGRDLREVFPALRPDTRELDSEFFSIFFEICNVDAQAREAVLPGQDGVEAFIEYRASYLYDDRQSYSGAVISFTDVTERRRAQEQLAHSQQELKKAHQNLLRKHEELQTFFHTVSHEVKTPLTAAREFVSLILEGLAGPTTPTQQEYLIIAQESCDQMRVCIDDLLDTTRLDTGKMSVDLQRGNLGVLLQRLVAMLTPAAGQRGIQLTFVGQPGLPEICMDEIRIAQVVSNLINNALKFTPEGGRVTVTAASGKDGFVNVTVADTGRGIPPEHLNRIFDRLYQVRPEDSTVSMGLGLGLHICKELVLLHDGRIWVESNEGRGSAFHVALPMDMSRKISVLLVDDDPALSALFKILLEREGFAVTLARDGKDALLRVREAVPDLLITDLAMPEMDGAELLKQLRGGWGNHVPVIIHTGYPDSELLARALEYSPFTLLHKSGQAAPFLSAVRNALAQQPPSRGQAAKPV